jgi:hypothetical protein
MQEEKEFASYLLQMTTIYNAQLLGWRVQQLGPKKYVLSKQFNNLSDNDKFYQDFDVKLFLTKIISFEPKIISF